MRHPQYYKERSRSVPSFRVLPPASLPPPTCSRPALFGIALDSSPPPPAVFGCKDCSAVSCLGWPAAPWPLSVSRDRGDVPGFAPCVCRSMHSPSTVAFSGPFLVHDLFCGLLRTYGRLPAAVVSLPDSQRLRRLRSLRLSLCAP